MGILNNLSWLNMKRLRQLEKKRGRKCVNCKSEKIKFEQYNFDAGMMYYCSISCHDVFIKNKYMRVDSIKKIEEEYKKLENK